MNHVAECYKATYSCHCLNVRVKASKPDAPAPNTTPATDFTEIFVAEDGVQVTHPHLVLRHRTRGLPIAGISGCWQYMSLSCLVCEFLVYRVYQIIPVDLEGKEGPILPTDKWVEAETMKSPSGWIEIHKDCISEDEIMRRENSPQYSAMFSITLPSIPVPTEPIMPQPSPPPQRSPIQYLSHMRPLFPPPPFSPTHPVFSYLSSFALSRSEQLRSVAEDQIAALVSQKVAEIEASEVELRRQVEILWTKFKEGIQNAEQDRRVATSRSPVSSPKDGLMTTPTNLNTGTPLSSVRDFVPLPVAPTRPSSSAVPRMSSLSASLATSSFHHPKYQNSPPRSPPLSNGPLSDSGSSVTLTNKPGYPNGSNVLQFRRNNNDAINTAASYRYFMNLEEEMTRRKREQSSEKQPEQTATPKVENPMRNGHHARASIDGSGESSAKSGDEIKPSPSKGKRKVTFDVKPDVVTIDKDEVRIDDDRPRAAEVQEMVFDLEDEEGERPHSTAPALPLLEPPTTVRPRNKSNRKTSTGGLPASFSGLLPASLPAFSEVRLPDHEGRKKSSPLSATLPHTSPLTQRNPPQPTPPISGNADWTYREAEIMRLVAANVPSHRGAWRKDGPAWQKFTANGNGRIDEEPEDDKWEATNAIEDAQQSGIPRSLPIPVKCFPAPQTLSLSSYHEHGVERNVPLPQGPQQQRVSSSAVRRAAYAERDRQRSLDPGALDFSLEEDDEEGATEEMPSGTGHTGRDRALRILQARSSIPEAGMWRSLA